jgi:hypothetical protein
VIFPEGLQQLPITDLLRVVVHFDYFRVPRAVRADVLVGRVFQSPARVAHRCRVHARQVAERLLDSPETPRPKCCFHRQLSTSAYGAGLASGAVFGSVSPLWQV